MSKPACAAIWTDILTSPPPGSPGFAPGADGWGTHGFFNFCFFVYQPDTTPFRIIRYNVLTGRVDYLVIQAVTARAVQPDSRLSCNQKAPA